MHDPAMLDAFRNGVDFHKLTAARTYGITLEEVTKAQRALSKILNFSILYGAGMRRITESLRYGAAGTDPLTVDEAEAALKLFQGDEYARPEEDGALYEMLAAELLGAYHRENPLVRVFMNRASASSQEHGHILTAFGNTVNIPKDKGHIAANAIIQGSAAGMMKETLIRTASLLEESFCPKHGWTMWDEVRIVTTIHDELCVELPSGYAEECARLMEPVMRRWPQFEVPIEVEFALVENGSSWAYKKDMKLHA
jgi:DNA polymerase-1